MFFGDKGPHFQPRRHDELFIMQDKSTSNGSSRVFYTVDEVSKMFGVSKKTVYRLLYRGLLKSSSALRHKMITAASIHDFVTTTSGGVA